MKECGAKRAALFLLLNAPRRGAGLQFTSSTAIAVPLPLEGKDNSAL